MINISIQQNGDDLIKSVMRMSIDDLKRALLDILEALSIITAVQQVLKFAPQYRVSHHVTNKTSKPGNKTVIDNITTSLVWR